MGSVGEFLGGDAQVMPEMCEYGQVMLGCVKNLR